VHRIFTVKVLLRTNLSVQNDDNFEIEVAL
jgi:hypothetical protein